jgi:flagellar biosynthesis protein FlhB
MEQNSISTIVEPTSRQYALRDTYQRREDLHFQGRIEQSRNKIRIALVAIILFMLVSSPCMYRFMESILGRIMTVSVDGMPTNMGLLLHSILFGLLLYLFMVLDI